VPANKDLPDRRFRRRADFDYSSAAIYFVTICTKEKRSLFGRIAESQMLPNRFGRIVQETWHELPDHYPRTNLDCFTLMPNHVHGVLALVDPVGAGLRPARVQIQHSLSEIIRAFKGFSARAIAELDPSLRSAVWQRGFYDHIIRNADDLANVRRYIHQNAARWEFDRENQNR
jgi:putative transposase